MIEIAGLTKRFGPITAVAGIDLSVARGEVLGFLGPNGAGKSTTMKMVAGYLAPDGGRASICGHDVETDTLAAKARPWMGFPCSLELTLPPLGALILQPK